MSQSPWSPDIECASRAQLLDHEAPLIAEQIKYVFKNSEYYRNRFEEAGVKPEKIVDHESLKAVPFMEKHEITEFQKQGHLFGPHQCAPFKDILRICGTGGTSGQPTRIGWTAGDLDNYNEMGARGLWTAGCRPGELAINCLNYSLYAGGVMDHMTFETLGAAILPYSVGRSERLLDMLAGFPPPDENFCYAIYSTPSYALRLHELASSRGMDLRSLGFAKGYFAGEPGMQVPGYRERLEEAWGFTARDLYGAGEFGVQSGECEHKNGLHYSGGGLVVAELIDPDTGEVIEFEDGSTGELVYTTLKRRACPMVRLRTHDVIRIFTDPCPCGRTSFRFQVLGRSDDMFIVKGVNVFPLGVQEALLTLRPSITGEFFIELPKAPPVDSAPYLYLEICLLYTSDAADD